MAVSTSQDPMSYRTDPLRDTLGRVFALRWETLVFVLILAAAIFTRFYMLGDRAMSHDESLHVWYSYNLYLKGDFDHTPLMHGPILFHATALSYALFGASDFSGRIYAAVLGVLLVMSPLLYRRWLGRWGVILASLMLLISPLMMYYNRYIRHDTPSILAAVLMAWAILMYLNGPEHLRRKPRWLYVIAATMIWNLGSKETAFIYVAIFGIFLALYWGFRMLQAWRGASARTWFTSTMMAILVGGVMALGMYIILDIVPLPAVMASIGAGGIFDNIDTRSFILWTMLTLLSVMAALSATALWAFRSRLSRVPWREIVILFVAALVVLAGLIFIEERSHVTNVIEGVSAPVEPGSEGEITSIATGIRWLPILIPWVMMFTALGLCWQSRRANWWRWLDQFAELDLIIVIATLILPWATAIFIVSTSATSSDLAGIGLALGALTNLLPVNGPEQAGQFVIGFLCWLPMMVTAIAVGLTWNWRRWLVCFLIFHSIFAFFFTTVFTNIQGLATGMIYSLQYWLEQQGERRGSQPQYYYLTIIMPLYEFLPVIGAIGAALTGVYRFWVKRGQIDSYMDEEDAINRQLALAVPAQVEGDLAPTDNALAIEYQPVAPIKTDSPEALRAQLDSVQGALRHERTLTQIPFLLFVSWWAILNLVGYTLAGEKMPWLGTHLTMPLIFLAAWYFGGIFDKINWTMLRQRGWIILLLIPLGLAAIVRLLGSQLTEEKPFQGVSQLELGYTYSFLAAAVVLVAVIWAVDWIRGHTGNRHARQMFAVGLVAVLGFVTFRSAWVASFINYDYANEFLVYAHATPGTKTIISMMEDISRRTTDGMNLKFAYDHKLSWPGVWYFRDFTSATYMGATPTLQQMEQATVVLVGDDNRSVVEPLLEERYQRFDFKRMWWPMQDYMNLNAARVIDVFDLSDTQSAQLRRGIWDIFWNRDYTAYGLANNQTYTFDRWPVAENMYMYVRKDVAAQVWQYGTGDGTVLNPLAQTEASACVANWQQNYPASVVFDTSTLAGGRLQAPIGIDVSADGRVFVADTQSASIVEFTTDGQFVRQFGTQGIREDLGAFFDRPHSVQVGLDGSIYVVDTWNYLIRRFEPTGAEEIGRWGSPLTLGIDAPVDPKDGFWGPREIAIDMQGNLYVADTGNKRVRVYDANGVWLRDIGRGGSGPGQLDEPTGIAVHPDGRVFVADTWNRRIAVFNADGSWLANYPVRAWYDQLGNRPYMAIDPERNLLYVGDPDAGRVLVLNPEGECLGAFGRRNTDAPGSSEFSAIGGVDVDGQGNIYVVDSGSGRVLKYPPFPVIIAEPDQSAQQAPIDLPPGQAVPLDIPPDTTEETQP